jgi:regulatory protein
MKKMKKSRFNQLKRDFSFEEIKSKFEFWCAYQERSVFEVENKLLDFQNLNESQRNNLIESLIENDFLNENRFIESFVSGKINIKKWGKLKIKYHLISKKIPSQLITLALKNVDNEVYINNIGVLLLRKNDQLKIKYSDKFVRASKVSNFLTSKGYESELIIKVVNERIISND